MKSNNNNNKKKREKNPESWPAEETLRPGIKRRHLPERLVSAVQLHPCDQDAATRWHWQQWADAIARRHRTLWCEPRRPTITAAAWFVCLFIYFSIHLFGGSGRFQAPSVGKLHPAEREGEKKKKKKVSAEEKRCIFSGGGDEKCLSDLKCLTGRAKARRGRGVLDCRYRPLGDMFFLSPK